jgi:UDP-N-acetylmuramate dehydrogenase
MSAHLNLSERLACVNVRGKIEFDKPLSKLTWFKVGGAADVVFTPEDTEDLAGFLKNLDHDIPVMALGVGSNLLVRDGGFRGVIIRFGRKFSNVTADGVELVAGAGTPDITVSQCARDASITGLEFLRGVPGTIGGALKMNAGAYGSDIAQIFRSCTAVDRKGNIHYLKADDMGFSYRHSSCPDDFIFTEGIFEGASGIKDEIAARMKKIAATREESQPLRSRTGGSSFKNPEGKSAWKLIDDAGCRGLLIGGAQMSEKHCNFMINTGDATADDIETLGQTVRTRVFEHSGIMLEWEIKRIGEK